MWMQALCRKFPTFTLYSQSFRVWVTLSHCPRTATFLLTPKPIKVVSTVACLVSFCVFVFVTWCFDIFKETFLLGESLPLPELTNTYWHQRACSLMCKLTSPEPYFLHLAGRRRKCLLSSSSQADFKAEATPKARACPHFQTSQS